MMLIYLFLALVFFPKMFGRDSKRIYNKFMEGWSNPEQTKKKE